VRRFTSGAVVVVLLLAAGEVSARDNAAREREVVTACAVVVGRLAGQRRVRIDRRAETCQRVALAAAAHGVDLYLALSLAWHEAKFKRDAVSRTGRHFGAMQVDPTFCCPDGEAEGCDLVVAGVLKIGELAARYDDHATACCHYNAGLVCAGRSERWGRLVAADAEALRAATAALLRAFYGRNDG